MVFPTGNLPVIHGAGCSMRAFSVLTARAFYPPPPPPPDFPARVVPKLFCPRRLPLRAPRGVALHLVFPSMPRPASRRHPARVAGLFVFRVVTEEPNDALTD